MGDIIQELPIDDLPPTNDEKDMIQWMFQEKKKMQIQEPSQENIPETPVTNRFHQEIKAFLIIITLYLIIGNQWSEWIIKKTVPIISNSSILLLFIKSIIFAIILMIFFNLFYKKI